MSKAYRLLRDSTVAAAFVAVVALVLPASAAELAGSRGLAVETVNQQPAWMVRVDVDHPDRIYQEGELMWVTVTSEKEGYLYLFYCDAGGKVACVFPNRYQEENQIPAKTAIQVPSKESAFRLRITAPFGTEVLKAVVTTQPLKTLDLGQLKQQTATPLSSGSFKGVMKGVDVIPANQWAEHHVVITTYGGGKVRPDQTQDGKTRPPQRIGVFVGISQYQSKRIPKLEVGDLDARKMEQVMKERCQLSQTILLVNEQATLKRLEEVFLKQLKEMSRPGDVLFLFWSGHGGRCADDNGDEPDGYDEYLVPYDGQLENVRKTMLVDDAFGRWLQELDGRRLVLILDTCHSGGQAQQAKGIGAPAKAITPAGFDFLDGEITRAKDVGQKETALLTSSKPSEVSFERREGDMSVMTYFLVEQLGKGSGSVSLRQGYDYLKDRVAAYVQDQFPGTSQHPMLLDNTTPPLYLRP